MRPPALAALAAVVALSTSCGDPSNGARTARGAAPGAETTATGAAPLPTSYRFVLTSSCGERGLLGDYGVTVRDERVTEVVNLNEGYPYQPETTEVPTLSDLLDMAGSASPETVELVVDEDGLPRSLSLDPVPNGIDDEECYEVTDLQRLS